MPRVLFIASHRLNRSPSQRYRFEQYFNFLKKNGFHCELSYIISKKDDDFISLTDMAKSQMQEVVIIKWLSLKSTIEYLGEQT